MGDTCGDANGEARGEGKGEVRGDIRGEFNLKWAAASLSSASTSSYTWEKDSQDEASDSQLREDRLLHGLGQRDA